MKKYYEIESDDDCDLDEEDIEDGLNKEFNFNHVFKVREIPKIDVLTHENVKCTCNNFKVIADGNEGMERG